MEDASSPQSRELLPQISIFVASSGRIVDSKGDKNLLTYLLDRQVWVSILEFLVPGITVQHPAVHRTRRVLANT